MEGVTAVACAVGLVEPENASVFVDKHSRFIGPAVCSFLLQACQSLSVWVGGGEVIEAGAVGQGGAAEEAWLGLEGGEDGSGKGKDGDEFAHV